MVIRCLFKIVGHSDEFFLVKMVAQYLEPYGKPVSVFLWVIPLGFLWGRTKLSP